jgi:ATP phosphoribosyltransferase regulatory subunit HisZ
MTSISTQREFAVLRFDFTVPVGWMVSPGLTGLTHLVRGGGCCQICYML